MEQERRVRGKEGDLNLACLPPRSTLFPLHQLPKHVVCSPPSCLGCTQDIEVTE